MSFRGGGESGVVQVRWGKGQCGVMGRAQVRAGRGGGAGRRRAGGGGAEKWRERAGWCK